MSAAVEICPKCGRPRTRTKNSNECKPCEQERKRAYAKKMVAKRKAEKAAAAPDLPKPEPMPALEREMARESEAIFGQHQENLSALTASLADVTRLRERSAAISAECARQAALIDRLAEEGASDEELGVASNRQAGLQVRREHAWKHQHAAELSLQRRLSADIKAQARLEWAWTGFVLDRETERFSLLIVEGRRDSLLETCRQLAQVSISYETKLAGLGERALESFAWSRPLDAPQSQKTAYSTGLVSDPIYAVPQREQIVGVLLDTAQKAIKRWELLLAAVGESKGFALPSYEEPIPEPAIPPVYPDTTKEVHAFWTPADLDKPDWQVPVFTPKTA
jgi:hypothetical protein